MKLAASASARGWPMRRCAASSYRRNRFVRSLGSEGRRVAARASRDRRATLCAAKVFTSPLYCLDFTRTSSCPLGLWAATRDPYRLTSRVNSSPFRGWSRGTGQAAGLETGGFGATAGGLGWVEARRRLRLSVARRSGEGSESLLPDPTANSWYMFLLLVAFPPGSSDRTKKTWIEAGFGLSIKLK